MSNYKINGLDFTLNSKGNILFAQLKTQDEFEKFGYDFKRFNPIDPSSHTVDLKVISCKPDGNIQGRFVINTESVVNNEIVCGISIVENPIKYTIFNVDRQYKVGHIFENVDLGKFEIENVFIVSVKKVDVEDLEKGKIKELPKVTYLKKYLRKKK